MKLDITKVPLSIVSPQAPSSVPFDNTGLGIAANTIKGIVHPFTVAGVGDNFSYMKKALASVLSGQPIEKSQNPWLQVAADIGQGISRTVGSVGLTAMNETLKHIAPALVQQDNPVPAYLSPIFGDGTNIRDIPFRIAEEKKKIESNKFAKTLGLDKQAAPLALGSIIGTTALDLSGLGGEKGAFTALAKETDPSIIGAILQKMGLSEDIATKLAPHIATVSREKDVRNILDIAKSMHGLEIISGGEKAAAESISAETLPSTPTTAEEAASRYYTEKVAPEVAAGRPAVIGADDLKDHFNGDYDIEHHPTYSKAANDLVMKAAEESPSPKVILTAGGPASGKTELVSGLAKTTDAGVIYDSNLSSLEGARQQIAQLRALGKEPEIHMILQDPKAAYGFSKAREAAGGHPVSDTAFVRNHAIVPQNVLALAEQDGVPIYVADARRFDSKESLKAALDSDNLYVEKPIELLKKLGYNEDYNRGVIDDFKNEKTRIDAGDGRGDLPGERSSGTDQGQAHNEPQGSGDVLRSKEEQEFEKGLREVPKTARTPALELARLNAGKDGKSWTSLVKGYIGTLSKEEKVHFFDLFATPEFVLEKIGLAKGAEKLQDAKDLATSNLKKEIETIKGWRARVGKDPYSSTRIFRYLDGQAKEVFHEMTDEEKVVAKEMKEYLKNWADRLHLPEDNRISNYITHIFDDASVEGKASVFEQDPELAAIMADKPAGSVYDPFTQRRLGKKGYKEDVWAALDAYVKRGTRKEAMDPALEYLKEQSKTLDDSSYKYVRNLTHRINLRPTEMDIYLDNLIKKVPVLNKLAKGPRPTMFLTQKIRQIFYRGALGLNVGSALRNLSQGANTYAKLGEKYTIIGYTKTLSRLLTNNFDELKRVGVLSEELNQDRKVGVYKTMMQKADPVLFGMFEVAEKINRGAAYYGAKAKALKKGLDEEQAVKYAKRMVRETQFAFGNVDSPAILASDIAKTAGQLGTYNLKQIEFLGRMAKNKEIGGLVRYTLASLAFVATLGKMFGMTVDQLVPSVGLGGSPVGNLVTGIGELMSPNTQTKADGKNKLKRAAVTLVPGGAQIKKTVEGVAAYNKGKDTTATGKTRFKVHKGTASFLQNALFGKSSTKEARAYYDSLGKKKKKTGGLTI